MFLYVYRQGSVIVNIALVFGANNDKSAEELLQPLKKDVESGRIGALSVDPKYFKVKQKEGQSCVIHERHDRA